jgi:hypothetical protein
MLPFRLGHGFSPATAPSANGAQHTSLGRGHTESRESGLSHSCAVLGHYRGSREDALKARTIVAWGIAPGLRPPQNRGLKVRAKITGHPINLHG